jgi:hypothetical protein
MRANRNVRLGRALTASADSHRGLDVCHRYAAGHSMQPLTGNDADVTEQVVCDVSVSERMQGRNQRATKTIRVTLRRCRLATVAGSRASSPNAVTAPPCSGSPAALRAAMASPRSIAESSRKRSALRCLTASAATRSGVSRRSLCPDGSSFANGAAQPAGLDRFLWTPRHGISQAQRRPDGARGERTAPCLCDCAGVGDDREKIRRDARETAPTRTTSAGPRG